jgi:peptidyl-prolyl cis-trans isomerase D
MLRLMRKNASTWIIKILLGAIVVVFVFWGVGSFSSRRTGRAALVNGQAITLEEYRENYNNLIDQLRLRFGNNLNDKMIEMLQVKEQALNQLIDRILLVQEAKRLNFRVSDRELTEAIREMDVFQVAGVFDPRLYDNVLNRNRLTPETFEHIQRQTMLTSKLRSFVTGETKVSDPEAMEWFKWDNVSVNIDYVLFEPEKYKEIELSDKEVTAFFDKQKAAYKIDPKIMVRYLRFEPDAYQSDVEVTPEEIRDYYDSNPEEFKKEKTVEARHILIKLDPDAAPELVEKKKKKALDIFKMAEEGKSFSELAKQYSECPSKDKGGYLGTFGKEAMVPPFAERVFRMKAGEISEPVRTRFGWHIIKVEKVNEESSVSFEEAESNIQRRLKDEKARNLAYDSAEAAYDAAFDGEDLLKVAESRKLNLQTTGFFTIKGPEKGIKDREKFASIAFNLSLMEISDVQDLGDGYYILQPIEKKPERIPDLKEVEEKVRADLRKEKQGEMAKKDASELLSLLKAGDGGISRGNCTVTPKTTGYFKRNDAIPEIGYEPEITRVAFMLSRDKKLSENIIKGKNGYYIISLNDRKEADPQGFDHEKSKIKEMLLLKKKNQSFDAWLSQIRNRSDISVEKDVLK